MDHGGTAFFVAGIVLSACSARPSSEQVVTVPSAPPVVAAFHVTTAPAESATKPSPRPNNPGPPTPNAEKKHRDADCQTVADAINASVTRIKSAEFSDFVTILQEEAAKLDAVRVETRELRVMVNVYATMAREVAGAAKDLADVLQEPVKILTDAKTKPSPDLHDKLKDAMSKVDAAQERLDAATSKEDPLVGSINRFCGHVPSPSTQHP